MYEPVRAEASASPRVLIEVGAYTRRLIVDPPFACDGWIANHIASSPSRVATGPFTVRQQPALATTSKSGGVAAATRPIFASSASGQVRSPHLCAFHCINWPRHECSLGRGSPPSRPPFHPQMRCSPSPCCSPTGVAAAALPTRKTQAHSGTNHSCHDWLASVDVGRAKARNAQHTQRPTYATPNIRDAYP